MSEREKFSSRTLMSCQLNNFTSGREGGRGRERKRDRERESSNKAMPLLWMLWEAERKKCPYIWMWNRNTGQQYQCRAQLPDCNPNESFQPQGLMDQNCIVTKTHCKDVHYREDAHWPTREPGCTKQTGTVMPGNDSLKIQQRSLVLHLTPLWCHFETATLQRYSGSHSLPPPTTTTTIPKTLQGKWLGWWNSLLPNKKLS